MQQNAEQKNKKRTQNSEDGMAMGENTYQPRNNATTNNILFSIIVRITLIYHIIGIEFMKDSQYSIHDF